MPARQLSVAGRKREGRSGKERFQAAGSRKRCPRRLPHRNLKRYVRVVKGIVFLFSFCQFPGNIGGIKGIVLVKDLTAVGRRDRAIGRHIKDNLRLYALFQTGPRVKVDVGSRLEGFKVNRIARAICRLIPAVNVCIMRSSGADAAQIRVCRLRHGRFAFYVLLYNCAACIVIGHLVALDLFFAHVQAHTNNCFIFVGLIEGQCVCVVRASLRYLYLIGNILTVRCE